MYLSVRDATYALASVTHVPSEQASSSMISDQSQPSLSANVPSRNRGSMGSISSIGVS